MRRTARPVEMCGGSARQGTRLSFRGPEFAEVAHGLFKVVAKDLRALSGWFPDNVLEPVGMAVVEFRA